MADITVSMVKELREQNVYLVLDPRRTGDGYWEIRAGGVGEGVDHDRALWYHRYAKDEVTEKTMKEKRVIEKIVSRKTEKKKHIYEIKYINKPMSFNTWHEKEFLFDHGWKKSVDALDARLLL